MMSSAEQPARRRSRRLPILLPEGEVELRTWVQLARTFGRMQKHLEQALEAQGVSLAQFDVLATLRAAEGVTQQELAASLLVTKGNICGMIDRMEGAGLVERRPDPQDRRANRMYLTRRGKAVLEKTGPEQFRMVKQLMQALDNSELQRLYQYLDRLEEGL